MNGTIEGNSRLLVVDDNRAIHADFQKVLGPKEWASAQILATEETLFGDMTTNNSPSESSFQLDSAYQGQEALELVQLAIAQGRPYAMAFMDVRMPPGWDGIETTAKIWEVDPDLQIVICTAYSDYSWDQMLDKLGRSDRVVILKKPFDNVEVLQLAYSLTKKWQLLQVAKDKLTDLEKMVAARTTQVVQEQEKFRTIFENSPEGIFQISAEGRFLTANAALARIYGYVSPDELIEHLTDIQTQLYVEPSRSHELRSRLEHQNILRGFESEIKCRDGSRKWINETACRVSRPDGSVLHYQGFVVDISEQKKAQKECDQMEANLRQAQKLEAVGQLAAGIAHEINTPIQYIGDNIGFVEESFAGLIELLRHYQELSVAASANAITPALLAAIESFSKKADIAYLCNEIPLALRQSLEGVNHVAKIVRAMKEFSHPGSKEKVPTDLNRAIETTITVARNEWKYVAELVTDLDPVLPKVPCLPAEFNQVILNLVVNASHAIADVVKKAAGTKGEIKICTRTDGNLAEIRISDTGTGIPENIRHRIFDPFFTTKDVGKGTGQGLAIARSSIVGKHGGELDFESTVGRGTVFIIRLPISPVPIPQRQITNHVNR